MSFQTAWNDHFDEFIFKLKKACPQAVELWSHHDIFRTTRKVNPQVPVTVFLNIMHPFSKMIFDKDKEYFLRHDKIEGSSTKLWGKYWDTLSKPSQEALWGYLQNLMILCYGWVGLDTFNNPLLQQVINESAAYMPEKKSGASRWYVDDFKDLKEDLQKKYG